MKTEKGKKLIQNKIKLMFSVLHIESQLFIFNLWSELISYCHQLAEKSPERTIVLQFNDIYLIVIYMSYFSHSLRNQLLKQFATTATMVSLYD